MQLVKSVPSMTHESRYDVSDGMITAIAIEAEMNVVKCAFDLGCGRTIIIRNPFGSVVYYYVER